ncbi:MAG: glycosyltransferase [Candidatus Omnitrophica bacterium]|nr:glycosyltransferase [Candidatus Omnitrophota bacterium]
MAIVSVIIPTYNCGEFLKEALDSVFGQDFSGLEVIVVDGGSTDSTETVASGYRKEARFSFYKKPGFGISAARNFGIRESKGELIAFLDGDDLFLPGKISCQASGFLNDRTMKICYTDMAYFNTKTGKEMKTSYYNFSGDIFYYLKRNNFIHPSAVMARRSVFEKELFDEKIVTHEDWEFFLRLAYRGVTFSYIDTVFTRIRIRPRSISTNTANMGQTRRYVGLKARAYWKDFKREISPFSIRGWKALFRYLRLKLTAALRGFPKRACFNRPLPVDLLS